VLYVGTNKKQFRSIPPIVYLLQYDIVQYVKQKIYKLASFCDICLLLVHGIASLATYMKYEAHRFSYVLRTPEKDGATLK